MAGPAARAQSGPKLPSRWTGAEGAYCRVTTRVTRRLDQSRAPHVRLWAPLGLDNPPAGCVGEGASRGER
jgi:hypothetical protein